MWLAVGCRDCIAWNSGSKSWSFGDLDRQWWSTSGICSCLCCSMFVVVIKSVLFCGKKWFLGWLGCAQGFREHEEDMQFKPSRMCGMLLTLWDFSTHASDMDTRIQSEMQTVCVSAESWDRALICLITKPQILDSVDSRSYMGSMGCHFFHSATTFSDHIGCWCTLWE